MFSSTLSVRSSSSAVSAITSCIACVDGRAASAWYAASVSAAFITSGAGANKADAASAEPNGAATSAPASQRVIRVEVFIYMAPSGSAGATSGSAHASAAPGGSVLPGGSASPMHDLRRVRRRKERRSARFRKKGKVGRACRGCDMNGALERNACRGRTCADVDRKDAATSTRKIPPLARANNVGKRDPRSSITRAHAHAPAIIRNIVQGKSLMPAPCGTP
jgi:hypothetical protein